MPSVQCKANELLFITTLGRGEEAIRNTAAKDPGGSCKNIREGAQECSAASATKEYGLNSSGLRLKMNRRNGQEDPG